MKAWGSRCEFTHLSDNLQHQMGCRALLHISGEHVHMHVHRKISDNCSDRQFCGLYFHWQDTIGFVQQ